MYIRNILKLFARNVKSIFRLLKRISLQIKYAYLNYRNPLNTKPIIIIGNQKTGSTAIADLLAKATNKTVTLDVFHRINYLVEIALRSNEISLLEVSKKYPFLFSTDIIKEPGLTFLYEQLLQCFPEAKFVFILRDPRDNIRSILNRLNVPGNLSDIDKARFDSLPTVSWRLIIDGEFFNSKGKNYIETLANRWNVALSIYENNTKNIKLIRYEDFIKDKVGMLSDLAVQLELKTVCDISRDVDKQYQQLGDHSITWIEFFGKENLLHIESICQDGMKRHGYKPVIISED